MHVIEDSRRFARSKGNTLRGVTLKVSLERLTLYHFRVSSQCQGSSHSRMNLLRSKDVVFVSCVWLSHTPTQYGSAESNRTETPIVYRFTQKSQEKYRKKVVAEPQLPNLFVKPHTKNLSVFRKREPYDYPNPLVTDN